MAGMMTVQILTDLEDGVLTITINNPEARNALSQPGGLDLIAVLRDAAADPGARVVVITGAGTAFCAGGDVRSFGSVDHRDKVAAKWANDPVWAGMEQRTIRIKGNSEITTLLHDMGKPTIAMVRGAAAGAGMAMALACDFRIASPSAVFTTAFAKIGVSGDSGLAFYLTKLVGPTKARELLFFSDKISGEAAAALGLVSRLVAEDDLLAETTAFARRLAAGPPIAYRYIKQNLLLAESIQWDHYLEMESRNMVRCFQTEDSNEAIRAFTEKRSPEFVGR
jgi:2-(1,2-epoxy-1,2-dihydrophenyl)acetyl-CoA isomerase